MNHKKLNRALIFSVILPKDSPRINQRLLPCLEAAEYYVDTVVWRSKLNNYFSPLLLFFKTLTLLKKKKIEVLYCVDPIALIFSWPLKKFSNVKIILYDRNERWPINWTNRKNWFQRICSQHPKTFIFFESFFVKFASLITGPDLITLKQINTSKRIVIPNRVFNLNNHSNPISKSIDLQNLKVAYTGTVSNERGWTEICIFIECLSITSNISLSVASRQNPPTLNFKNVSLDYKGFVENEELIDAISKCDFGIAYFGSTAVFLRTLPSKISTYFQLGIPVIIIGSGKLPNFLSRCFHNAIYLVDIDNFNYQDFSIWVEKNPTVNFKARSDPKRFIRYFTFYS